MSGGIKNEKPKDAVETQKWKGRSRRMYPKMSECDPAMQKKKNKIEENM